MKILLTVAALVACTSAASAQYFSGTGSNPNSHSVSGYVRSNGTYVAPSQATNPNNTQLDNYSTRGNVNPFTGQTGTRSAFK